jgi:endonuclease YncB( thermonuclease family)
MKYSVILIFLLTISFGCKSDPATVYVTVDPLLDSAAKVTVGRVIDGDTFVIGFGRDSFSVRILGIDDFEIRHDDSQAVQARIPVDSAYALGQAARRLADSLLSQQNVLLVRDFSQPDFDTYNRLLRHVYYYQGPATFDYGALLLTRNLALVDTL